MRLEFVEVVNFRGISQLRIELESENTVLFGENAWGKTSLVEALQSSLGSRPIREVDFHRLANKNATIAQRMSITLGFVGEAQPGLDKAGWVDGEGKFHLVLQWAGRRLDRSKAHFRRFFLGQDGRERLLADGEALAEAVVQAHPLVVFRELRLAEWMLAPTLSPAMEIHEEPERAVRRVFERLLSVPHQVHPGELARGLEALRRLAERRPELFSAVRSSDFKSLRRVADIAEAPLGIYDGRSLADMASRAGAGIRQVALLALIGAMLQAEAAAPAAFGAHTLLVMEDPETHLHPIQLATAWNLLSQLPGQKLITSAHGQLLASVPTSALRRLVRKSRHTAVHPALDAHALDPTEARRVAFHVRTHNAESLFARVWLLVEGETEAWLLPELARISGLGFPLEGIRCVAFAQAGLVPLIAFADRFGIPWHLVADGDDAGRHYLTKAKRLLRGRSEKMHMTILPDRDLEHFMWKYGFESVYRRAATHAPAGSDDETVLHYALKAKSKPGMALEVAEEAGRMGPQSIPPLLRRCFATLSRLALKG